MVNAQYAMDVSLLGSMWSNIIYIYIYIHISTYIRGVAPNFLKSKPGLGLATFEATNDYDKQYNSLELMN